MTGKQNAYYFRRGVVLPLNEAAEQDMRRNDVHPSTAVRVVSINDEVFGHLIGFGIIKLVNERCNVLLDDHEEAWVEVDALTQLAKTLAWYRERSAHNAPLKTFLGDLQSLTNNAIELSRPILFVL